MFRWNNMPARVAKRICKDDKTGIFVAETWAREFKKYTPADTMTLSQSYTTRPFKITYTQPYSHYQWNGVSKSGKRLVYSKERNALAGDHWEQRAKANCMDTVIKEIENYWRHR